MHHAVISDAIAGRIDDHLAIDEPMDFSSGERLDFADELGRVHFRDGDRRERDREERDTGLFGLLKLELRLSLGFHPFFHVNDLLDSLVTLGKLSVSHDTEEGGEREGQERELSSPQPYFVLSCHTPL